MNFNFTHVEFTWNTQNIQKQKISRETTNLTIKDLGIWGVKKVAMLNWLLFSMFFFFLFLSLELPECFSFPRKKSVWFIGFFFRQGVRESFWLFSLLAVQNIDVFQLSPKFYLRELFISSVLKLKEQYDAATCFFTLYLFHWVKWISREPQARKMQKKNTKKRVTNTSLLTAIAFFFLFWYSRLPFRLHFRLWFQKIKKIREQATL